MKASKLMDSLNYLDDELIRESETKVVATDIPKKKAKITRLIPILAIAASLLIIGTILLNISSFFERARSADSKVEGHRQLTVAGDSDEATEEYNTAQEEVEEFTDEHENVPAFTEAAVDEIPDDATEEFETGSIVEEEFIVIDDIVYTLIECRIEPAALGEVIGEVESSSNDDYVGLSVYEYKNDIVVIEFNGEYVAFELSED